MKTSNLLSRLAAGLFLSLVLSTFAPVARGQTLEVLHVFDQLVLSWPTDAGGFTLQSSPELGPSANWGDSTDSPVTVAEQYFVTNSISATAQFYRLKK
jgi:hypothetical protein